MAKLSETARQRLDRLKPFLSSASSRTDAFLQHTSRLLTTANGIDNTLATVLFTATLLHSQLVRVLTKRYEKLAFTLASKASESILPGETIVASIEPPASRLSRTCAGFKELASTSAEVWMALRLFGLFHIYRWAREFYERPHRDVVIKTLVWAQIGAAATFQFIENFAFLAYKGILQGEKWERRAPRWMAISNRFWMAQIVLEGLRLLRVRQLNWNEEFGAEGEKEVKIESERLKRRWHRDFYGNAGWLPLTLHWSYVDEAESPVTEVWQGLCGLLPSIYGLQDAWRETA